MSASTARPATGIVPTSQPTNESVPNHHNATGAEQDKMTIVTGESFKKRQMDYQQCLTHSQTSPGALALTNPTLVKTSNADSNRGLYPRQPPVKSSQHQPHISPRSPNSPRRKRAPKEIPNQSRITAFFPPSPPAVVDPAKELSNIGNVQYGTASPSLQHVKRSLPFSIKTSNSSADAPAMPSSPSKSVKLHPKSQRYTPPKQSKFQRYTPPKQSTLPFAAKAYPPSPIKQLQQPSTSACAPVMPSSPSNSVKLHPKFQRYTPPKQSTLPFAAKVYPPSPNKQMQQPSSSSATRNTPPKRTKPLSSVGMYTSPKRIKPSAPPSTMSSLLEDFDKDTCFDSKDVEDIMSQAESIPSSSPCKSSQGSSCSSISAQVDPLSEPDILDDFENDTAYDCPALWDIVEKAESDTSSPCKSVNTFGLLGEGGMSDGEECDDVDLFSKLPIEVMENIFCRMPMMDLCLNINVVCKAWNEIISREKFLYWKKRYYRYKLNIVETRAKLFALITEHEMTENSTFLLNIVKYVQNFRNWVGSSMLNDLKRHHNFNLANDLLQERIPELTKDTTLSPWCMIAALAILANSVSDVTRILTCLLNPMATCTSMDIVECLYCVATLLLMLQRKHNTNRSLHYQVFYALYLYENSFSDIETKPSLSDKQQSPGQQSRWKYGRKNTGVRLTHEQVRIVAFDPKPEEVVRIVAFAGSGKTTTLIRYAQRRPHMRFLYVAFNRAVKEHAQQVFPHNVTSKTTHSLAYQAVGFRFANAKQLTSSMVPKYVHRLLPPTSQKKKNEKTGMHWITRAKLVIDTLKTFMNSKEDFITTLHVPNTMVDKRRESITSIMDVSHSDKMKIADDATHVWQQLIDVTKKDALITHDVYLKLYQLQKPEISHQYDCLLIDEAQDLTPVQQDILLSQQCAKILVGDPNQQIYSFRGAQNAMEDVQQHLQEGQVIRTFHLTQSFRFGPEIAYVANLILEFFKEEKTKNIVGKEEPGGILGDEVGTVAIICRTNLELFDQAVRICDEATAQKKRTRIGFAGGVKSYGLDILIDIYLLYLPLDQRRKDPRQIKTGFIRGFKSFTDLRVYSVNAMDVDLENKIKIVQKYSMRIPAIVADIYARDCQLDYADIILSTAHKSKGLEFDTVKLTEDYNALYYFLLRANGQSIPRIPPDEMNLVYVAITRAKKRLVLNYSLMKFLQYTKEYFIYPVSTQSVLAKHDTAPKCLECDALIESSNHTTSTVMIGMKPKLKVCFKADSTHMPTSDGYICGRCMANQYSWYEGLCRKLNQEEPPEG